MFRTVVLAFMAVVVLASCASSGHRKVLAEIVALEMYANVEAVTKSERVPRDEDTGAAAPGQPGSYRRAVIVHDSRVECSGDNPQDVSCGARVEVFRTSDLARDRAQTLREDESPPGQYDYRSGPVLLRVSGQLTPPQAAEYTSVIEDLADALPDRFAG